MSYGRYKIAYLCLWDPLDKRTNSGTQRFMVDSLRKHNNEVHVMFLSDSVSNLCLRVMYRLYKYTHKNSSLFYNSMVLSRFLGFYFTLRIMLQGYDLVFVSRGSPIIPFLKTSLPIVYTSDATFRLMMGYYDNFTEYDNSQFYQGDYIENAAIHKSKLLMYPSAWAANSAIEHYGADPELVRVVPSGANFDEDDVPARNTFTKRLPSEVCRVLFVGRDWLVKGGATVLEAVAILRRNGIPAILTVVGCIPPSKDLPEWVEVIPFLNKNNKADAKLLANLFTNAHFFVLPTRNETFGLVFAEACAYGLPVVASNTGGIPTIVENDVNGYLLPLDASGRDYAEKIDSIWTVPDRYINLSNNSRDKYDRMLNWHAWGDAVQVHLNSLMTSC